MREGMDGMGWMGWGEKSKRGERWDISRFDGEGAGWTASLIPSTLVVPLVLQVRSGP